MILFSAVLISEVVKLLTCLVIVFFEEGHSAKKFVNALHTTVIKNYMDTLKICVPSVLYVIQNNLLYLSASHLDAATYQVRYSLPAVNYSTIISFTFHLFHRSVIN